MLWKNNSINNLGVKLLVRENRHFHLTKAGEYLYQKSGQLLDDFERIKNEAIQIGCGSQNALRLGYLNSYSGMSSYEQMTDNISYMKEFQPLNDYEMEAVRKVQEIFKNMNLIPCTACRYCKAGCPKKIAIPDLFAVMNTKQIYHDWNADYYYNNVHTAQGRKASDCIKCGKCEKACPQHLEIRRLLEDVAKEFEK